MVLQRTLDHGAHSSFLLEIVLYDGQQFVAHDEVPCSHFGEVESGLTCLTDDEGEYGLSGSTILLFGSTVGVLVPRPKGLSGLFKVQTEMRSLPNPAEEQMKKLSETKHYLEVRYSICCFKTFNLI